VNFLRKLLELIEQHFRVAGGNLVKEWLFLLLLEHQVPSGFALAYRLSYHISRQLLLILPFFLEQVFEGHSVLASIDFVHIYGSFLFIASRNVRLLCRQHVHLSPRLNLLSVEIVAEPTRRQLQRRRRLLHLGWTRAQYRHWSRRQSKSDALVVTLLPFAAHEGRHDELGDDSALVLGEDLLLDMEGMLLEEQVVLASMYRE